MESLNPKLGNLAQKARKKTLDTARNCLIAVGILQLIGIGLVFFLVKTAPQEFQVPPGTLTTIIIISSAVAVAYFVLAALSSRYPLACTTIGLILFITLQAIAAIDDPASLAQGWILKIIVIVALVKAVQAAVAYEKERKSEAAASPET